MPVVKLEKINSNAYWCLWEISETLDQLERNTILSEHGLTELNKITHATRKMESLASRRCLQEIFKEMGKSYQGIYKDIHNKPHLVNNDYHISISHSYPYAVGILHKKLPVGIDIEKPIEKLRKVAPRFLQPAEFIDAEDELKKLCVYWTGKEAIFKLNGRRTMNFKENIKIHPFVLRKRDVIRSEMYVTGTSVKIALNYREIDGHFISFCF
ncbi:MAG: 4'-phosphopantetheinyl transferase family protein [Cyclobacteriaceae bacterium]